jgi:zinc protease
VTSRSVPLLAALCLAAGCGKSAPPPAAPTAQPAAPPPAPAPPPAATAAAPVVLPASDEPVVSVAAWFQVGSYDDPPGKEGVAWLTAQMIARGATAEHSYEEILELLYPMATDYAVSVDREMTVVHGRAHRDHADAYLGLFTQAFTRPAFRTEDFERLRAEALAAIQKRLRYALDEELGKAALYDALFPGTGYAHPPQGLVASLEALTVEDVQTFWRANYTPDRVVFGVAGGHDPKVVERLQAARAALPAAGAPASRPAKPEAARPDGRKVLLVHKPGADASISLGAPIPVRRGHADYAALAVAISWLGEHRASSSHLYRVIRERRGMNYGDYAYIEAYPGGGFRTLPPPNVGRQQQLFEIWIRTLPNENAVFALRAALRETDRLIREGMTAETLELQKRFLAKYLLQYTPSTHDRLLWALDDRYYGLDRPFLESLRRSIAGLTLEQVNAAIKRHLSTKDLVIAIATGKPEELRDALVSGAKALPKYATPKPKEILAEDEEIAAVPLGIEASDVRVVPVDEMFQRTSRTR